MMRKALALLLLPSLALAGTFVTNPASTLPGPKSDSRPLPAGADPNKFLRSSDYNALRDAANDLRDYVRAPNDALVTSTGGTTARALKDRAADEVWITDHGAKCDGSTDDSAAFVTAITKAMETGKTLRIPAGTCRISSVLMLPNDAATPPTQRPLKIVGAGAHVSGRGTGIVGGTVLDMRGAGAYGKFVTSGLGLLEITGVTFTDSSGGTTPFIYTTNTTLHVHDSAFIGTKGGALCDQDAIILGGTEAIEGQGGLTHGFQGYGTVIRDNFFERVRRAVYLRVFANATTIADNTIWANSGGPASAAAIEVDGINPLVADYASGGMISGNLIETTGYVYGIKLAHAVRFALIGNNFYDATPAQTLAMIRFESTAIQNLVIDGYGSNDLSGVPMISDATTSPSNTRITSAYQSKNKLANETEINGALTVKYGGADIFSDDIDGTGDSTISIGRGGVKKYQLYLNHLDDSLGLRDVAANKYPWKYRSSDRVLVFSATDVQVIHPDNGADSALSIGHDGAKKYALYNDSALNNVGLYDWTAGQMRWRVYNGTGLFVPLFGLQVQGTQFSPPTAAGATQAASIFFDTAAPTTGAHVAGDRVFNSAPAVGQPKGWICTVAGTPGTWVSEGNL